MFKQLKQAVQNQFETMKQKTLFSVEIPETREKLWELYLSNIPEEVRQEYNCNCCKSFIRNYGHIVTISDTFELISIWDIENIPEFFKKSVKALTEYVKALEIQTIFLAPESKWGIDSNKQLKDGNVITWEHFYLDAKNSTALQRCVSYTRDQVMVYKRGLDTITSEALDVTYELITTNQLYRGQENKENLTKFISSKYNYSTLPRPKQLNYVWKTFNISYSMIRNTSFGTFLIDLSEGIGVEQALKAYERITAPTNYRRPTAPITQGMIDKTIQTLKDQNVEDCIYRRHANITDIPVNHTIYKRIPKPEETNPFAQLSKETKINENQLKSAKTVKFSDLETELSYCDSVEFFLENSQKNSFVNLTAKQSNTENSMFSWNNNIAWSYISGTTDSIKEKVKAAGGNIDAFLRVSLEWYNFDDLDLHCQTPFGEIYYANKVIRKASGQLDIDMNAGGEATRTPVENIFFDSSMPPGEYKFAVHQFQKRENIDTGFAFELAITGQSTTYKYDKPVIGLIPLLTFVKNTDDTYETKISTTLFTTESSQLSLFGLKTQTFIPVNLVCFSPNHWETKTGNKHIFFILEDALNPEPVRGFYTEYLNSNLNTDRKVLEKLGEKTKIPFDENQLMGVGFSETQRNSFYLRITKNQSKSIIKVEI